MPSGIGCGELFILKNWCPWWRDSVTRIDQFYPLDRSNGEAGQREAGVGVDPLRGAGESGRQAAGDQPVGLVLIGALGPDALPCIEFDVEPGCVDMHRLLPAADEMHLHAR